MERKQKKVTGWCYVETKRMKVSGNMFIFLYNDVPSICYKEWARGLKYNNESRKYYVESYCFNTNGMVSHSVTVLDSDGIVFLCKLLARFRSLRHQ